MFMQNKYTIWYYNLINRAQKRILADDQYYERHHILPKSIGGTNDNNNLVNLTGREHYIAHLLLVKITTGSDNHKMKHAVWRMLNSTAKQCNRYKSNSWIYEEYRQYIATILSTYNKGKPRSAETIAKLRNKIPWNKGRTMSEEFGRKISQAKKSKSRRHRADTAEKTRQSIIASYHTRVILNPYDYSNGLPRIRWMLLNSITGETIEITNLGKFCQENKINSKRVTDGKTIWKVVEKYRIKTGERLL